MSPPVYPTGYLVCFKEIYLAQITSWWHVLANRPDLGSLCWGVSAMGAKGGSSIRSDSGRHSPWERVLISSVDNKTRMFKSLIQNAVLYVVNLHTSAGIVHFKSHLDFLQTLKIYLCVCVWCVQRKPEHPALSPATIVPWNGVSH